MTVKYSYVELPVVVLRSLECPLLNRCFKLHLYSVCFPRNRWTSSDYIAFMTYGAGRSISISSSSLPGSSSDICCSFCPSCWRNQHPSYHCLFPCILGDHHSSIHPHDNVYQQAWSVQWGLALSSVCMSASKNGSSQDSGLSKTLSDSFWLYLHVTKPSPPIWEYVKRIFTTSEALSHSLIFILFQKHVPVMGVHG